MIFPLLLLVTGAMAAAQAPQATAGAAAGAAAGVPAVPDERTLLATINPSYLVTPGDVYALSYWVGTTLMTMNLTIDSNYGVNLEAFGIESAKGLTFVAFKSVVKAAVARAYPASWPQVSIVSTGVFEVYLKGEVANSGYRSAWGLTRLSEVLEGQLTPYSSTRDVQILAGKAAAHTFDLFEATRNGRIDQDPYVRPDDAIAVKPYHRQSS